MTEPSESAPPENDVPDVAVPEERAHEKRAPGARTSTSSARGRWGRAFAGAGVLLLAGGVLAAGSVAPPYRPVTVEPLTVEVPPPVTELVCPGPLRLATEPEPGADAAYDPQFDPAPSRSAALLRAVTVPSAPTGRDGSGGQGTDSESPAGAAAGSVHALGDRDDVLATLRPGGGPAVATADRVEQGLVVRAEPVGQEPGWAAGAVVVTTPAGDLRGSAAASCQTPGPEAWLVGGSTDLGSSARLVLQNAGGTPASVEVELWGPAGRVELAGSPEYLVPPGSERAVLLEGVAAQQKRIVVHVRASGGLVAAYLQDSQLRGLVPAGVDYVVPGEGPALRQVVAGVSVTPTELGGVDTAVLRLLAPGTAAATAQVRLLGPDGPVALPGTEQVALEPGAVLDVPLGGLPAGDYTAVVDSDEPVVAAALVTRGRTVGGADAGTLSTSPVERAWVAGAGSSPTGVVALPASQGRLVISVVPQEDVSGPASLTVEAVGADGSVLGIRGLGLSAGTTTVLPLDQVLGPRTAEVTGVDPVGGEEPAGGQPPPPGSEVVGLVVRSDDPRISWAVVLLTAGESAEEGDELISVLLPVRPQEARQQLGVALR